MEVKTRRGFLLAAVGAGALAALSLGLRWAGQTPAETPPAAASKRTFRQTGYALGSSVAIVVLHEREPVAQAALAAAFSELRQVEEVLSLYRPASQLSRLNQAGSLDHPHPYLLEVLQAAQTLAQQSAGAFDVTVQPLWDVYASAQRSGSTPSDDQVRAAVGKLGHRQIRVTPERIQLQSPGMAVTLNGIAQGYAADRVMAVLAQHGITEALINTGEVGPLGRNQDGRPWRVGIQHPRQANAYIALADLAGRSLATSGDYATTFTADRRDHHIFDPATGRSPTEVASVSVVAPTTMLADGLSTTLFVLGPGKGRQLIEATSGTDALFVLKDGSVMATSGFPRASA